MFQITVLLAGTVFCLLGCFAGIAFFKKRNYLSDTSSSVPVAVFCITVLIAATAAFLYDWQSYDFVSGLSLYSFIAAGISALIILAASVIKIPFWSRFLLTSVLISVIVLFFSATIPFFPEASFGINAFLTVILWIAISFSVRLLSLNLALPVIEFNSICFGAFFLWLTSALPMALGVLGLFFAVASIPLIILNWYPQKLPLSKSSLDVLGFLLGLIVIFSSVEQTFPCFFIFMLYLIVEILWSVGKKLTFLPPFKDICANTFYYQSELSGLSPALINGQIIRINFLLLMFGCFQAFSPNAYSVPILCIFLCLWLLYRLQNWHETPNTLKEANKEFVSGLKQNIDTLKETFSKTDNNK